MVVGLGNPGTQYNRTRHNVGQDAVELLAQRHQIRLSSGPGPALSGHGRINGLQVALAFPGVFMNVSGPPVGSLVRHFRIEELDRLVIIHDELDLEPGRLQLKLGGGLAGHNGLKSVKAQLKSDEFARVRIGIGRPDGRQPVSDYVLRRPVAERADVDLAIEQAGDAVEMMLADGLAKAMGHFNRSN